MEKRLSRSGRSLGRNGANKAMGWIRSAWVETTVSVRKLNGTVNRGIPFDVLSYPSGRISKAYVLSDENVDTDLQLTWSAPTHLRIYHRSDVNPDLEVVRFADIDISFRQGWFPPWNLPDPGK